MSTEEEPVIYYLGIWRNDQPPSVELIGHKDVSSFSRFTQKSAREFIEFLAKTLAERTKPGVRQDVEKSVYKAHAYGHSRGVCGLMVTNITSKWGRIAPQQCLSKLVDEFLSMNPDIHGTDFRKPPLEKYIIDWRDMKKIDNISSVQQELDATKDILHKTIESVLERGERLDELVAKSDNLSSQSKMFYSASKKQNSCCVVM